MASSVLPATGAAGDLGLGLDKPIGAASIIVPTDASVIVPTDASVIVPTDATAIVPTAEPAHLPAAAQAPVPQPPKQGPSQRAA
jgi:hypothetical protein